MGKRAIDFSKVSDKQRVNSTAIFSYTVIAVVLAACYLIEVFKKERSLVYYLIFLAFLLLPFIACKVVFAKDKESDKVKYAIAAGFFIFNNFVIFTTDSPIAYVYALVIGVVLICYNDNKLMFRYMMGITLSNIVQAVYTVFTNKLSADDIANIEIRIGSLVLYTLCVSMSSIAASLTNRNRLAQIEEEKEKTSSLMGQILNVSNQMSDNVEVVYKKMEILKDSATQTKSSMENVVRGTTDTVESIQMQLEKTEEIDSAINQVSESASTITDNIESTIKEIDTSKTNIDDLIRHVELSNKSNQEVSDEIEKLNEDAKQMQNIIDVITSVTSQTSILALNASIEAARAGDAGKGFAVVASEISNLAVKTKEATVDITQLISNVSTELKNMVTLIENMLHNAKEQNDVANNTAKNFEEISVKVDKVQEEANKLNEFVKGLSSANKQVVLGIETISAVTEEVTAQSNETMHSTEENSVITDEVKKIVETLSNLAKELTNME